MPCASSDGLPAPAFRGGSPRGGGDAPILPAEVRGLGRSSEAGVRLEVAIDLADRVVQRALERLYPRLDATLYALVTFPAVRAGEAAGRRSVRLVHRSLDRLEQHYVRCLAHLDSLLALDGDGPPVRLETRRYRLTARSPQAGRLLALYERADRLACGIARLWLHGRWDDAERGRALYALVKRPLYACARDLMRARTRFLPPGTGEGRAGTSAAPESSEEGVA